MNLHPALLMSSMYFQYFHSFLFSFSCPLSLSLSLLFLMFFFVPCSSCVPFLQFILSMVHNHMHTQLTKHCEITQESVIQINQSINRGIVLEIGFGLLPPELACVNIRPALLISRIYFQYFHPFLLFLFFLPPFPYRRPFFL